MYSSEDPAACMRYEPLQYGLKAIRYRVRHFGHSTQWRRNEDINPVRQETASWNFRYLTLGLCLLTSRVFSTAIFRNGRCGLMESIPKQGPAAAQSAVGRFPANLSARLPGPSRTQQHREVPVSR